MAKDLEKRTSKREERRALRRFNGAARTLAAAIGGAALLAGCKECEPNYASEFLSNPVTTVNEKQYYEYIVKTKDPEQNVREYFFVGSPWLNITKINDDTARVYGTAPEVNADKTEEQRVQVSDGVNVPEQKYSLTVKNVPEPEPEPVPTPEPEPEPEPEPDPVKIEGSLQDNEKHTGQQGTIMVYRNDGSLEDGNPLTNPPFLKKYEMTSPGNFSFNLEELASELSKGVVIQAAMGTYASPTSYIRTVTFPKENIANALVRVIPHNSDLNGDGFADLDFDKNGIVEQLEKENYRRHVELTNGLWLAKFNLANLDRVEIMSENRKGPSWGYFSNPENLKEKLKIYLAQRFNGEITPEGELYLQGKLIFFDIIPVQNEDYSNFSNKFVYEPYNDLGSSGGNAILGKTSTISTTNDVFFIDGAWINLLSNLDNNHNPLDYVLLHEGMGHSTNLSTGESYYSIGVMPTPNPSFIDPIVSPDGTWNRLTVMQTGIPIPTNEETNSSMGIADLKTKEITLENTFQKGEEINNYLRLNWGFQ